MPSNMMLFTNATKAIVQYRKIYSCASCLVANFVDVDVDYRCRKHMGKLCCMALAQVADLHRTVLYGGWCGNPRSHLRLVYEAAPLAFLVEQAGCEVRSKQFFCRLLHDRKMCIMVHAYRTGNARQ